MKRNIVSVLCLILIFSAALVGCQQTAGNSAPPSVTASQSAEASQAPAETQNPSEPTAKEDPLNLSVMAGEHANQPFKTDSPVFQWILEKANVNIKLESFPGADWTTKAQTLMATDTMPDMMLKIPDYEMYAREGAFLCVSDYLDAMPNFKAIYEKTPEFKSLLVDGKLYGVPNMARYMNRMGLVPMIRGDLIEKYGLKLPTTFDELTGVLKVFKEKSPDVYPWVSRGNNVISNIAFPMGAGMGMYYDGDVEGGKWLYGQATDEFKTVISYVAGLYKDGLLDIDYATTTAQQWQEKMSTGKGVFYFDNPSFAINFDAALKKIDPSFEMTPMPTLANGKGQARNYYYAMHWLEKMVVNVKVADPERTMKFVDWLYSEEGTDLTNFGIVGQTYTKSGDDYTLNADIVAEHKQNDSDPWRGFQGKYGIGLLGFAFRVDERSQWPFMDPTIKGWYDLWINDNNMRDPAVAPSLTEEERSQVADILTKCNTIYEAEVHNFITGKKDISAWDDVVKQFKDNGSDKLVEIYNAAAKR